MFLTYLSSSPVTFENCAVPDADEATIQNSSILDEWEEDLMRLDVSTRRQHDRRESSFFSRGGRSLLGGREEEVEPEDGAEEDQPQQEHSHQEEEGGGEDEEGNDQQGQENQQLGIHQEFGIMRDNGPWRSCRLRR